jgi:hypothetical protein
VPYLKRIVAGFPPRLPGFEPRSDYVGFVVDKASLGHVSSQFFDFPLSIIPTLIIIIIIIIHHPGLV